MSLVLDSSTTLAWCFEDERGPDALAVIERVVERGAWGRGSGAARSPTGL